MKRLTAVILTVMMLCTANVVFARDYAQRFWDVPKDYWGFEYIADLTERGVIKGYEDGSFKPENIVLRSEWAKMMVTAAGLSVNDNGTYFTDTNGHWANSYINTAKNYLTGYSDGSYRPDQAATREDVTVAMVKLKGYDLSDVDYSYLNSFRDVDSISNYAKGYVAVAIKNNLISGFEDNTFRGQDTLTRAEAATLMYRAFKHGNADKVTTTPTTPITSDTSKSNEDYAKQAEPKYDEPKQETKKTEDKSEEPKTEVTNDEPQEDGTKAHYEVTTLIDWQDLEKTVGDKISTDIYTAPYKDGVVFTANRCVLTLNNSKKCKLICNFDDIQVGDILSDSVFKIYGVAYDSFEDRILVSGYGDNNVIYELKDGECNKIAEGMVAKGMYICPKGRFFVLSNGDIIANNTYNVIDWYIFRSSDDYMTLAEIYFDATSIYDNGDYLTYVDSEAVQKEDFSGNVEVLLYMDCDVIGVYKDLMAVVGKGQNVAVVSLTDENSAEKYSIKVKDAKFIDFKNSDIINVIDKNGSFIFYDYTNKAFRYAELVE